MTNFDLIPCPMLLTDTLGNIRLANRDLLKIIGKRIEEVAVDRLTNGREPEDIEDPLDKFIGAFNSGIPDWADNHDKYIGEALMREMRGEAE